MLGFIAKNPSKSGALCGMSGERASGGKKHQHSRCRSCAGSSKSCCPYIQRRLKRASLLWRGSNGAIIRPISRIVNAEKRRAKESGVVGIKPSITVRGKGKQEREIALEKKGVH